MKTRAEAIAYCQKKEADMRVAADDWRQAGCDPVHWVTAADLWKRVGELLAEVPDEQVAAAIKEIE